MAEYRLTWLAGRSTPVVTRAGAQRRKTAGGKVIASRMANAAEKKDIEAGRWVRSRPPGHPGKKSSVRPQLAAKQKDARPRTLYVCRKVKNAAAILAHYSAQGLTDMLSADDLHVTVVFSRRPVDWFKIGSDHESEIKIAAGGPRAHEMFGEAGDALVLQFANWSLSWRNERAQEMGASWDWPDYSPHITLSYKAGDLAIDNIEPWTGEIILGPELFEEIDEDWKSKIADDRPGLWANIRAKREREKRGAKTRKARKGEKAYPEPGAFERSKT